VKCDFFRLVRYWDDSRALSFDREPDQAESQRRGTSSRQHVCARTVYGGEKKGSKGGSSGTMVNIVILRGGKNETNMQKAVLDPRKALYAAAQVSGNGRKRHSPFWLLVGRCLPLACLCLLATVYGTLLCAALLPGSYSACLREKTQTAVRVHSKRKETKKGKKERKKDPTGATRYGMFPRSFALASLALAWGMK